jgi:hypothetical protein
MSRKFKGPKVVIAPGSTPTVGGIVANPTDPLSLLYPEGEIKIRDRDLEFLHELGAGSGGSVSKVRHIPSGTIMARKVGPYFGLIMSPRDNSRVLF